jgi:hypothetical protein
MHHGKRSRFMLTSQPILHFTETRKLHNSHPPGFDDDFQHKESRVQNLRERERERERENQPEDGLGKGKRRGDNP